MCYRMNNDLSNAYKNTSPIIWTIPVISEPTIYEFQFKNSSANIPNIGWAFKYYKCTKCNNNNNNNINNKINKKDYGTLANKCVHYKSIQIHPTANRKVIRNIVNYYLLDFKIFNSIIGVRTYIYEDVLYLYLCFA